MEQQLEFSRFTRSEKYEIGDKIQTLRKQRGWTLEKLSEATGIDPKVISRHQNGGLFNVESMVKYACAFGCQMEDLLPTRMASQINGDTEGEQKYWSMLLKLTEAQKRIVFGMISELADKPA